MSSARLPALGDGTALLALLRQWADHGWIRDLDMALAAALHDRRPDTPPLALLAAALVSHQAGRGHLLLDLERTLAHPDTAVSPGDATREVPDRETLPIALLGNLDLRTWTQALRDSPVAGDGTGPEPLVLNDHQLYLRRYWRHERTVITRIQSRLDAPLSHDEDRLRTLLDALFPHDHLQPYNARWQKLSCALAARNHFAVITGGPGTGKTTTVIRLLALVQALALEDDAGHPLRVRLAAPTGKAAARLNASIGDQAERLDLGAVPRAEEVRNAIPTGAITLHRLLGASPASRAFHHHRWHPLPLDLVIVDEASMVDVEMMAALLEALPDNAGLVLLGDKDQLASVEAGAVLGNLCARATQGHYLPETRDWLHRVTGTAIADDLVDPDGRSLDQVIGMLRHSHRFAAASGIGRLAAAINRGADEEVQQILADPAHCDLRLIRLADADDPVLLRAATTGHRENKPGHAGYLELLHARRPDTDAGREAFDTWAGAVLQALSRFQLLCALRQGPYGVTDLNDAIEAYLASLRLITPPPRPEAGPWYEGRPVLITGNDYELQLMNGDMGVALDVPVDPRDPGAGRRLRVAFPAADGRAGIRWVLPARLRHCETVYAMTVHKAQGSEFHHTALVLPDAMTPVLTRELVYTAVTRAGTAFTLFTADPAVLPAAVRYATVRASSMFR